VPVVVPGEGWCAIHVAFSIVHFVLCLPPSTGTPIGILRYRLDFADMHTFEENEYDALDIEDYF